MKNIFQSETVGELTQRINQLEPNSERRWGKMTAAQMLAHCNVTYELIFENKHPQPNFFIKLILNLFVKKLVVGSKPYKENLQTASFFLIQDDKDFEDEKKRLLDYLNKVSELGESHFDNKESHAFGRLSIEEWNNMFYKHLDHHLKQFGV